MFLLECSCPTYYIYNIRLVHLNTQTNPPRPCISPPKTNKQWKLHKENKSSHIPCNKLVPNRCGHGQDFSFVYRLTTHGVVLSGLSHLWKMLKVLSSLTIFGLVQYHPTRFHNYHAHIHFQSTLEWSRYKLQSTHGIRWLMNKRPLGLAPIAIVLGNRIVRPKFNWSKQWFPEMLWLALHSIGDGSWRKNALVYCLAWWKEPNITAGGGRMSWPIMTNV